MKEKKKITRHTIIPEAPPRFIFLGLVTSEADYSISVMLNRQFGLSLQHNDQDIIDHSGDGNISFSLFTANPPSFSLISNKNNGNTLIKKLKNIDMFLVLHGTPDKRKAENLSAVVRNDPSVTAVFVFDSSQVNDKNIDLLIQ